jgi:hypothetical protein
MLNMEILMTATGNRQQATGNRQQATGNRQQATGNRVNYIIHMVSEIRSITFACLLYSRTNTFRM